MAKLSYTIPDPRTATPQELRTFADVARREDLIVFCVRNDRNGCYTDEQCELEFGKTFPDECYRAIIRTWANEESEGM